MDRIDRLQMARDIFRAKIGKPYYSDSYKEACKTAVEVLEKEMGRIEQQRNTKQVQT